MLRVLILDDDRLFGRAVQRSLSQNKEMPCDALAVETAEAARSKVKSAEVPFDVFLIDQRLDADSDGITVLEELLYLSPRSEAIVFTRVGDEEASMRAYRAGAYLHLHKPLAVQDLVVSLRALQAWRAVRQERDALKILTTIAERAQRALTLPEMGEVITQGGCQLGFQRARLWSFDAESDTVIGLSQLGNQGLEPISAIHFAAHESPYISRALAQREPITFRGEEHGTSYLHRRYPGFLRPEGQWIVLSLRVGDRCLGLLVLDNYSTAQGIRPAQLQELTLLGQQVAAAFERVLLYEQQQIKSRELERQSKEKEVLAEIGRLVSNRAAIVDLDALLLDVHKQVSLLMDVRTFFIALRDDQTGWIELRLDVDNNELQPRRMLPDHTGLVSYVIANNKSLFLPTGSEEFRKRHKIRRKVQGPPARCWLGVPLTVEDKAIGAIVVQSVEQENAYIEGDLRLLTAVANQVAGAIQTAWLKEAADRHAQRLELLQRAGEALISLAERDEQWLWQAALTIATAGYAFGFNRAMLFLVQDGGSVLCGHMGIGQLNAREARRAWAYDKRINRTFDSYLHDLRNNKAPTTPVDTAVRNLVLYLPNDHSVFREALESRQRIFVSREDSQKRLPDLFIRSFGSSEYALIPLMVGEKQLGVVIVDNAYNHRPLHNVLLNQLETWLAQVALVCENHRQHRISDRLIDINHTIFAQIASLPLKDTLAQICTAARGVSGADCVMIYPLVPDQPTDQPRYDVEHTGYIGLQGDFCPRLKPRADGVTMRVLQSRKALSVPDVISAPWFDQQRQTDRTFFHRENVRAFIAVPIRDVSYEAHYSNRNNERFSGILYLNFRTPQTFNEFDLRLADSFASMAGAAIHTSRLGEQVRQSRDARTRELQILQKVMKTALQPTVRKQDLPGMLLNAARELLDQPEAIVSLILSEWSPTDGHAQEPREMRRQYYLRTDAKKDEPGGLELHIGITGEAFKRKEDLYVPDVTRPPWNELYQGRRTADILGDLRPARSELDVLIKLEGQQILGLFNVESPEVDAFTAEHRQILRRLAAAAALALDNVRRQENLRNVLKAATAVIEPSDLKNTLQAVVDSAREIAPGVSAVTIWHEDPEREQIVLGPHFGVHYPELIGSQSNKEGSMVTMVMRSPEPIWEPSIRESGRLLGRFSSDERIESVAALPLQADGEMVGAIFFNYRTRHMFTREERVLFPIIAAVAAASVRDAARLEAQRKGSERLQAALDITDAVGTTLDLDQTMQRVMDTLKGKFSDALPCVLTFNPEKRILEFASASLKFYSVDEKDLPVLNIDGGSIACRVARAALASGEPAWANVGDVSRDDDYILVLESTRSELCLALLNADRKLLGVLALESKKLNAFDPDDVELVRGIGPAISIAIDRAYQNAELRFNSAVANATALVSEMAHDINREIGNIRHETYLLSQKLSADVLPYVQPSIGKIDASAGLLATYARAPRSTEAEALDLDAWIVQKVKESMGGRGASINLRFATACAGLLVRASPVLLERVLRHLVRNALDAMRGVGQLTVRTRRKDEQFAEVQVTNDGPPIPAHVRQLLFVDCVSTKDSERRSDEGGRGLLFARWAVEAMGGRIALLSKPPEDVTFAFTLPIAQDKKEERSDDSV